MKTVKCLHSKWLRGWIILSFLILHFSSSFAQPRLLIPKHWVGLHGGVSASSVDYTPVVSNMTPINKACVLGGNGGFVTFGKSQHSNIERRPKRRVIVSETLKPRCAGRPAPHWFLNAGPQVGYCIKDEGNHGTLVNGTGQAEYNPIKNRVDWGIIVGTGVYFVTKKAGLYQLEVRFDYSFGGIFGTTLTDHFNTASPMDLSLNVAWLMPVQAKHKVKKEKTKEYENKLPSTLRVESDGRKEL